MCLPTACNETQSDCIGCVKAKHGRQTLGPSLVTPPGYSSGPPFIAGLGILAERVQSLDIKELHAGDVKTRGYDDIKLFQKRY